jgi:hypothetical protein
MTVYSDTLRDENNAPIPGVSVYVYDASGQLASGLLDEIGGALPNPLTTDAFGNFSFDAVDGFYTLDLFLGGRRAWKQNVILGVIPIDGAKGLLAETRAALAAITVAGISAGQSALLGEAGREGTFVWSSANLQTLVTADTAQGIYVAPASAPTGASGAWVRKFSGPLDIRWFGAVGDCTATGVGTDNAPAINGAISIASAISKHIAIYIPGSTLPYRVASTLTFTTAVRLSGDGYSENPGFVGAGTYFPPQNFRGSVLVFDTNVKGIEIDAYTDNLANATAYEFESAGFSVIEDIMLWGGGGTTVTAHGIHVRAVVRLRNVRCDHFGGTGFHIAGYTGGANPYGTPNCSTFDGCMARSNFCHGFNVIGIDSNSMAFTGCSSALNGGVGYLEQSLIGNNYFSCHAATNNQSFGTATTARTQVLADWAGLSDQTAGSYVTVNGGGAENTYFGCYVEIGNGVKAELIGAAIVVGGTLSEDGAQTTGFSAVRLHASQGAFNIAPGKVKGQTDGALIDFQIQNVDGNAAVNIFSVAAGRTFELLGPTWRRTNYAGPGASATAGYTYYSTVGGHTFQGGGSSYDLSWQNKNAAVVLRVPTGTTNVDLIGNLLRGGTQVVGARDTGWAADTGTAKKTATAAYVPGANLTYSAAYVQAEQTATSTRLQLIESALRDATQEIKALKDALIAHGLIGT